MKDILAGFAIISVCVYLCLLPWISLFRICMVMAKDLRWLGIKIIDLSGFFYTKALSAHQKHKRRKGEPEDKELFGDSLEF